MPCELDLVLPSTERLKQGNSNLGDIFKQRHEIAFQDFMAPRLRDE
jgi:hypothetical protein